MDKIAALDALAALGQETRLDVFRLLVRAGPDGLAAGEIAARLSTVQNTMSAHLKVLDRAGLIAARREGRSVCYAADMTGFRDLLAFLMEDCCNGAPVPAGDRGGDLLAAGRTRSNRTRCVDRGVMSDRIYNVLFLCTGNSARSILAEAILNRVGNGRFRAFSAGSQPKGAVHPATLRLLEAMNHDTGFARSKSWEEFSGPDAPALDFVFTVCDSAAAESCPIWPGQPMSAHWGVPDPAAAEGTEAEKNLAFADAYRMLSNRIAVFTSLPLASIDRLTLQKRLDAIGGDIAKAG